MKDALNTFDIPLKNIKKYTRALLATIFISLGSIIISGIFSVLLDNNCAIFCGLLFYLGALLSIIFAILLAHYYFKGNFGDFEEFSRFRFLTKRFRTDYDFIFKIKSEFKMPFVLILISEFFNFINMVLEGKMLININK